MNFLIPVIVLVGAIGYWASRHSTSRYVGDPGVEANARLTGYAAVVLLLPLGALVVSHVAWDIWIFLVAPTEASADAVSPRQAEE